jgi:hypothetical protein
MSNDVLSVEHGPAPAAAAARPATSRLTGMARVDDATPFPIALFAAALCVAIGLVHIQDQGGFLGNVTPEWIAIGYYSIEVAAAITIPFLIRQKAAGWILAALVSIGPFIAYILSRTVGLPGDPGDVGNWGYTLGTVSLIVEGTLFIVSVASLARAASRLRRPSR